MKIYFYVLFITLLPVSAAHSLATLSAEELGLKIATEADNRDRGWKDMKAQTLMTLKNQHGQVSIRKNRIKTLEVKNDGDKSIIVFDSPTDIKGTAFLSHTHSIKADDQWLYLPSLKRIKRISSSNKSGPFLGSEFSYEDISSQEIEKYAYKYIKDDSVNGRKTYVLEQIPQYKNSGYKKQIVWLDKSYYQPLKIEFYDRKNTLLKTLTYHEYKQYLKKYWRAGRMEMNNHQTGKSTTLTWSNYTFNTGLNQRDFNKNSLKRAR